MNKNFGFTAILAGGLAAAALGLAGHAAADSGDDNTGSYTQQFRQLLLRRHTDRLRQPGTQLDSLGERRQRRRLPALELGIWYEPSVLIVDRTAQRNRPYPRAEKYIMKTLDPTADQSAPQLAPMGQPPRQPAASPGSRPRPRP